MQNILIPGGSGMIGQRLRQILEQRGYKTAILTTNKESAANHSDHFYWNTDKEIVDTSALQWSDAIINLAGAGIADERWTETRKKLITQSRVKSNELLLAACLKIGRKPKVYISSGGMNYYGDDGDTWKSEDSPKGRNGFLPASCSVWESAVSKWRVEGVRTVQFRIAVVLSMMGGALPKLTMTLPARIVPVFGNGKQWMSWIHIDDICRLILHALENENMNGIYNGGSPNPVRNIEFARSILEASNMKGITPSVPAPFLKLGLGEMSETVLSSVRLNMDKVKQTGFEWSFPNLIAALADIFNRKV
jgi:uncharacterized protein